MKGLSKNKTLFLELIERIRCAKSIQPRKEVWIVGHSVLDLKTLGHTITPFIHSLSICVLARETKKIVAEVSTKLNLMSGVGNVREVCKLSNKVTWILAPMNKYNTLNENIQTFWR